MTSQRSTREILDDHLRLAQAWNLEPNLKRNFSEEVVRLTSYAVFRGVQGARDALRLLDEQIPGGQ